MRATNMRYQLRDARILYKKLLRRGHWAKARYLKAWIKTHAELLRG